MITEKQSADARMKLRDVVMEAISESQAECGFSLDAEARNVIEHMLRPANRWAVRVLIREVDEREPELPLEV